MGTITVARVYDEVDLEPSQCVLIDRLWPRGLAKADAPFSLWAKDVAPSTELRKWYDHVAERFDAFADRYRQELSTGPGCDALQALRQHLGDDDVLLLTATKKLSLSHGTVLKEFLQG